MKEECVWTITISYLHLMKIDLIENVEIVGVASLIFNQVLFYIQKSYNKSRKVKVICWKNGSDHLKFFSIKDVAPKSGFTPQENGQQQESLGLTTIGQWERLSRMKNLLKLHMETKLFTKKRYQKILNLIKENTYILLKMTDGR